MAKELLLTISTPNGKVFEDNVVQVNANISEGRIGVLAKHSPLVSSLKISLFNIIYPNGEIKKGAINGGIFNVGSDEVTILTSDFLFQEDVDDQRANEEIKKIQYMLDSELKPMEKQGLEERLKYEELKLELYKNK